MFSHLTIGCTDLPHAIAFYDAILKPLGIERRPVRYDNWASWRRPGEAAVLWVGRPINKLPATSGNGWMAAFTAPSRSAVDAAHAAAMAAGGQDEGARPAYAHLTPPTIMVPMYATRTETSCTSSGEAIKSNGVGSEFGLRLVPQAVCERAQQATLPLNLAGSKR